jgi:hypothetical protein
MTLTLTAHQAKMLNALIGGKKNILVCWPVIRVWPPTETCGRAT